MVRNPDYETALRASFARQGALLAWGARLVQVGPGVCGVRLDYRDDLSQHNGFFHGGIVGTLADTAAGYAAFTCMEAGSSVLTVEYKINFLAPARGRWLIATGRIVKPGRTFCVSQAEVVAYEAEGEGVPCALLQMTAFRAPA